MEKKVFYPKDYMEFEVRDLLLMMYEQPVALIKKMYPVLGKEKTLEMVKESVWETASKTPAYSRVPAMRSFPDYLEYSKGMAAEISTGPLDPLQELVRKTIAFADREVKDNQISFKITRCLWSNVFRELGAPEIGYTLCCESDYPRAKSWSPKLELKRTQTIMQGAPYCDFCYTWKE